jgi:ankyrin repeat protein
LKVVKLLLNKGADITIKNVFGAKASETAKTYQIQDLIDAHKPGMTYKLEEDLSDDSDDE